MQQSLPCKEKNPLKLFSIQSKIWNQGTFFHTYCGIAYVIAGLTFKCWTLGTEFRCDTSFCKRCYFSLRWWLLSAIM